MRIIDFKGHHLQEMQDIGAQTWIKHYIDMDEVQSYEKAGPALTATIKGEIVGCAGLFMINPKRGIAWAVLDMSASKHFMKIHMAVLSWLREHKEVTRIEAFVDPNFENAVKWVKLLGFKAEAIKPYFFANGGTALEYVRFNPPTETNQ